jgi:hypothetical protein
MRRRWSVILPIYGLALFALITLGSARAERQRPFSASGRYFYWGAMRLDTDPLNKHVGSTRRVPCENGEDGCIEWDPETIWITPGVPERLLVLTAVPSFLIEVALLTGSRKLGISQIPVFFISLPILLFAWFYFLGWLIDRHRYKRRLKLAPAR